MPCAYHRERPKYLGDLDPGCPFNILKNKLISFNEKEWCQYHLPYEDDKGNRSEKAEWNSKGITEFNTEFFQAIELLLLENGRDESKVIDLSGVHFPGDISFESLHSKYDGLPNLLFYGVEFWGSSEFSNVRFKYSVCFDEAKFYSEPAVQIVTFEGDVLGRKVEFFGPVQFGGVKFKKGINFEGAHFFKSVSFKNCAFGGNVQLDNAICDGEFTFGPNAMEGNLSSKNGTFGGPVVMDLTQCSNPSESISSFQESCFFDEVYFKGFACAANFGRAVFKENAQFVGNFSSDLFFREGIFESTAIFKDGSFLGGAYFEKVEFIGKVRFVGIRFREQANFSSVIFRSHVSFDGSIFQRGAHFNEQTKFIKKASFRGTVFVGDVTYEAASFFGEADFSSFEVGGSALIDGAEFASDSFRKIDFSSVEFNDLTNFTNRRFLDRTRFENTTF